MSRPLHTVVLTGGPHAGKTTLVQELARRGHAVVPEAALALIEELNGELGVAAQTRWRHRNVLPFQRRVVELQRELEARHLSRGGLVFLDRGRLDGLAYCALRGARLPDRLVELAAGRPYDQVFVLDLVLPFDPRPGSGRFGDESQARNAATMLESTYRGWGYAPEPLALCPVAERADRLLERVRSRYEP